jgi:hypothetical protein
MKDGVMQHRMWSRNPCPSLTDIVTIDMTADQKKKMNESLASNDHGICWQGHTLHTYRLGYCYAGPRRMGGVAPPLPFALLGVTVKLWLAWRPPFSSNV